MDSDEGKGFGKWLAEHPFVVILGLVGSCIAIFTFITGINNLTELSKFFSENVPPLPKISFPTQQPEPEFLTVSLKPFSELSEPETNLGLKPGVTYLLDIPFDIGWKASTQCSHLPNQPKSYQVDVNIENPTDVYFLIQAGWGLTQYNGIDIGKLRLGFSDGNALDTTLTLGDNIRDWAWKSSAVVRTVSSSQSRPAWTGQSPNGTPGGMDILTITVPNEQRSKNLSYIQVIDVSNLTAVNIDPCIHVVALTVKHLR